MQEKAFYWKGCLNAICNIVPMHDIPCVGRSSRRSHMMQLALFPHLSQEGLIELEAARTAMA